MSGLSLVRVPFAHASRSSEERTLQVRRPTYEDDGNGGVAIQDGTADLKVRCGVERCLCVSSCPRASLPPLSRLPARIAPLPKSNHGPLTPRDKTRFPIGKAACRTSCPAMDDG